MQFGVLYLAVWGSTKPMLYSWHLDFVSFLYFWCNTHSTEFLHCISQCRLCLVSSLFIWFVDGACHPFLAVKMPNEEGCLLVWGGYICHNPLGAPGKRVDYRYSRLTFCTVSPVSEVCISNVICVIVSATVILDRSVFIILWMCVRVWM
jgi:hypothetical protein